MQRDREKGIRTNADDKYVEVGNIYRHMLPHDGLYALNELNAYASGERERERK